MLVADHPEGKIFFMDSTSEDAADRFLRFLLQEHEAKDLGSEDGRMMKILISKTMYDGMLEALIEGPHSGEIINTYRDELKLVGIDVDEAIRNYFGNDPKNILGSEDCKEPTPEAEAKYDQLQKLSVELFLRSCIEITLLTKYSYMMGGVRAKGI